MSQQSTPPKLLAQAAEGDRHSFGEFYELFLNDIYRYVLFRVNDHREAEDLTAKVFLDAWESLTGTRRKQQIDNVKAWIYRIAHNKVIDYRRTRNHQELIEDNLNILLQGAWLERDMDDLFISQKLADSVRRLPDIYQEVIILRFINQVSHAEAAEIMNITESHVRVLQYRALKQMREMILEEDDD